MSANPTKWSNTLKQSVNKLPTTCLSVFDHFVGLALKGLTLIKSMTLKFQTCDTLKGWEVTSKKDQNSEITSTKWDQVLFCLYQ